MTNFLKNYLKITGQDKGVRLQSPSLTHIPNLDSLPSFHPPDLAQPLQLRSQFLLSPKLFFTSPKETGGSANVHYKAHTTPHQITLPLCAVHAGRKHQGWGLGPVIVGAPACRQEACSPPRVAQGDSFLQDGQHQS